MRICTGSGSTDQSNNNESQRSMKLTEAMVFEYLKEQAKEKDLVSLSIVSSEYSGQYVAAYNETGKCGIGQTIIEAVYQLPCLKRCASDEIKCAEELEGQAKMRRDRAAKLLGTEQQPKSFGPDD